MQLRLCSSDKTTPLRIHYVPLRNLLLGGENRRVRIQAAPELFIALCHTVIFERLWETLDSDKPAVFITGRYLQRCCTLRCIFHWCNNGSNTKENRRSLHAPQTWRFTLRFFKRKTPTLIVTHLVLREPGPGINITTVILYIIISQF